MKYRFILLALAVALCSFSSEARKRPYPLEYAYGSSLEIQTGLSTMPFAIKGDAKTALGLYGGGDFQLRYTYFPGKHWGFFTSFSVNGGSASDKTFFYTVNNADGDRFIYNTDHFYHSQNNGYIAISFQLGAAYRYDFGRLSLRPRLGLGVADYDLYTINYARVPRAGGETVNFTYKIGDKTIDYLPNPYTSNGRTSFVSSAALQITYSIGNHFFISAECGAKAFLNDYYYYRTVEDAAGIRTESAILPRLLFNCNFGIGWNIGWNRNKSGKYRNR